MTTRKTLIRKLRGNEPLTEVERQETRRLLGDSGRPAHRPKNMGIFGARTVREQNQEKIVDLVFYLLASDELRNRPITHSGWRWLPDVIIQAAVMDDIFRVALKSANVAPDQEKHVEDELKKMSWQSGPSLRPSGLTRIALVESIIALPRCDSKTEAFRAASELLDNRWPAEKVRREFYAYNHTLKKTRSPHRFVDRLVGTL